MSNAVTALNGANYQGLATIADQGLTGMITPVSYTHLTLPTTPYV